MCHRHDSAQLPADIVILVADWIHQAGRIALNHFHHVVPTLKEDQSFLTKADIEIQEFLQEQIGTTFPEHNFIGEEEHTASPSSSSPFTWVVDPLDGTTVYALGLPGWGISIGLLFAGEPVMGFFYMPLLDDLTLATPEGKLYWNDQLIEGAICTEWLPKRFLAINATAHANFDIRIPNTRAVGSIGACLAYTARGVAAATFASKARIWDLVACSAIMKAAGGSITYIDGTSIDFLSLFDGDTAPQPIIAAHPRILSQLPAQIVQRKREA